MVHMHIVPTLSIEGGSVELSHTVVNSVLILDITLDNVLDL